MIIIGRVFNIDEALQHDEAAAAGSNFDAAGSGDAIQFGQSIVFTEGQFLAVEEHGAAAELAVAGEGIDFCLFGQFHGGGLVPTVVDD